MQERLAREPCLPTICHESHPNKIQLGSLLPMVRVSMGDDSMLFAQSGGPGVAIGRKTNVKRLSSDITYHSTLQRKYKEVQ